MFFLFFFADNHLAANRYFRFQILLTFATPFLTFRQGISLDTCFISLDTFWGWGLFISKFPTCNQLGRSIDIYSECSIFSLTLFRTRLMYWNFLFKRNHKNHTCFHDRYGHFRDPVGWKEEEPSKVNSAIWKADYSEGHMRNRKYRRKRSLL